jgi:RHS repeat-associated protein
MLAGAAGSATDPFAGLPNIKTSAPKAAAVDDGDYGVDEQRGAVTYNFPIEVPPGRNGMAPSLALSYSSQAPLRGGLAVGWTGLELPYIDIEPKVHPGEPKYRLGGTNRLVKVEDARAGATEVYRAEFDAGFTRWERWGDPDSPQTKWIARSLDGSRMEFARAPSSPLNPAIVPQWRLNAQVDAYGNRVEYHWDPVELNWRIPASDELHRRYRSFELGYIEYSSNVNAGIPAHARITFNYALSPTYQAGSSVPVGAELSWTNGSTSAHPPGPAEGIVTGARELQSITTSVRATGSSPWKAVRNTFFSYEYSSPHAGSSLRYLKKIDVSGYTESCNASGCNPVESKMPTVSFTYGDGPSGTYSRSWVQQQPISFDTAGILPRSAGHSGGQAGATAGFLDVDSDGFRDFVTIAAEPSNGRDICTLTVAPGQGAGGYGAVYKVRLPTMKWNNGATASSGDSLGMGNISERCTLGGQYILHTTTLCVTGAPQTCCTNDYLAINGYHFVDYNGDGRVDLLTSLWRSAGFRDQPIALYKNITQVQQICTTGPWDPITGGCTCSGPHCAPSPLTPPAEAPPILPVPLDPGGVVGGPGGPVIPGPPATECPEFFELLPERDGSGTFAVTPYVFLAGNGVGLGSEIHSGVPLPPPGEEGLAEPLRGDMAFTLQMAADLDANGFIDLISTPPTDDHLHYEVLGRTGGLDIWMGGGGPDFAYEPQGFGAPHFLLMPNQGIFDPSGPSMPVDAAITINATLMDMNGDGRSDLVYRSNANGHLLYFPNTGNRFSEPAFDLGFNTPAVSNNYHVVTRGSGVIPAVVTRMQTAGLLDVDQDGRPDLVQIQRVHPQTPPNALDYLKPVVHYNLGDQFSSVEERLPDEWLSARGHFQSKADNTWSSTTEVADVDGDGLMDLVDWDATPFDPVKAITPSPGRRMAWATEHVVDAPPRYLRKIDNGRGATTEFRYRSTSALQLKMPNPVWVVTETKTTPDVRNPSSAIVTSYTYESPKIGGFVVHSDLDYHALSFRGFGKITVTAPAPAGNLHGPVVVHSFVYDLDGASFRDGRGYKDATYTYDGMGVLQSVEKDTWEEVDLFGTLPVVRPTMSDRHLCTLQQQQDGSPEVACASSLKNLVRTYHNYQPYLAGTRVAFFMESGSTSYRSDASYVLNRYLTYKVDYPAGSSPAYRRQLATERTTSREALEMPVTTGRTEVVFDSSGFPKWTKKWWGAGDSDYATSVRTFDIATGNPTSVQKPVQATSSSGSKTTYEYDAYKLFVAVETNEVGHKVITTRDLGTGVVTRLQGPQSVTVPGSSCSPGPACMNEVAFTIDAFGRVVVQKGVYWFGSADASSTNLVTLATASYDDFHGTTTESHLIDPTATSPGWVTSVTQHDAVGRITSQETCRGLTGACPDPVNDPVTSYSYDSAGLLVAMSMPNPAIENASVEYTFQHDSLGRLTKLIRPGKDAAIEVEYSIALKDTTEDGDPDGKDYGFTFQRTLEGSAATGKATINRVDLAGNLVAVQECSSASCEGIPNNTQAAGWEVTVYDYDAAGRLVTVTDADSNNTALEYDMLGRRTAITRGTRRWSYQYDFNGNMTAEISPLPPGTSDDTQYRSTTTYDDLDRPFRHDPARRGYTATQQANLWIGPTNYFYDQGTNGTGRLTRVEQPRPTAGPYAGRPYLTVAYTYDGMGRVRVETRTFNTTGAAASDLTQRVVRASNALGSPMFASWDDGQYTAANFDNRGLTRQVTYTGGGSKTMLVADYGTRSRTGLPAARGTGVDFAGQERLWTYDEAGRVLTDRIRSAAGALADRTYVFDDRGLLTNASGSTRSVGLLPAATSNTVEDHYFYDRQYRLTAANEKRTNYNVSLAYSPAGNISSARVSGVPALPGQPSADRDVTYLYDPFEPQAVVGLKDNAAQTRVATMVYDDAGNMKTRSWPLGQDLQMSWDGENNLRQVQTADGSFERYHYDHAGQRVWAVKDTGVDAGTRYWFGESETFVPAASPASRRRYLYIGDGATGVARAERVNNGVPIVELTYSDALQNLELTTSVTGAVEAQRVSVASWFHFGAFGEVLAQGGADSHRREFNGKEADVTSGLRYYGARYYDPLLMRWNGADPLYRFAPDAGLAQPQFQNLYSFTANNPVRLIDPDGRSPCGSIFGCPNEQN